MENVLTYEQYRKLSDEGQDLHDKKQMEKIRYKIEILDSESFDKLPYKKTKESLGIALPEKGLAYIRKTGDKAEDFDTFLHELEELELAESWHEEIENGVPVRYKSFWKKVGDIFKNYIAPIALALIPGVGPVLSGIYTGINSYQTTGNLGSSILAGGIAGVGGMLGQSNVGYQAGVAGSKAAGGGMIGQTLSGAKGLAGNLLGMAPAATTGTTGLGTQVANVMGQPVTLGQTIQGAGLSAAQLAPMVAAGFPAQATSMTPNLLGQVGVTPSVPLTGTSAGLPPIPTAGQVAPIVAAPTTTPAAAPSLLKQLGTMATQPTNILGAGSLLASTMGKQPQFTMPSSFTDLQSKLMQGGGLTPLGQQAQAELGNIIRSTPQQLYPSGTDTYYNTVLTNLDNEYQRQKRALAGQWNAIDPNYMQSGEYILADQQLNKSYMEVKNNYIAQEEQRRFELGTTARYNAIQQALGVDQNVMNDLLGLTGLDVQTAAAIYGAQVADVEELRKALGTLGAELLVRGTTGQGMQKAGAININLMGGTPTQ